MINRLIKFLLENRLVSLMLLVGLVAWGIITSPFGWNTFLPSDPVAVDAIPDIGENQQIVFTEWPGRSPQDIEDQITYPLTSYLLGIPGVKSIRSNSVFGFSSIYIIFKEEADFYWSRSRILEKLNSLPSRLLPDDVQPALGPDATALGQVFWYTLEGRDEEGRPTGGWDLHEIRSVQDFYVKYALNAVDGVSEVASIGGFVQEYQVDVNPDALKAYNIPLSKVMEAVAKSNRDVGAKTIEVNQAEYLIRGLGYLKSTEDLEKAVVAVQNNVPIHIRDIGVVSIGPAARRGVLDKEGAEVVGGVVVARYGANPMQVIVEVKAKIKEIASGLPQKTLNDGRKSTLTIVPFYDRSTLIHETLGTLEEALSLEILITILVVLLMVFNLRASLLISSLLPIAVLMVFIAMRYGGVDANIVALSGIAIAIGTMVDLGVILSENIIKHKKEASADDTLIQVIYRGASEVSGAIITAVTTTIVSFIPVFTLQAAEGKLFGPLAYTKTFALIAALIVSLFILPTLAYYYFGWKVRNLRLRFLSHVVLSLLGVFLIIQGTTLFGWVAVIYGPLYILKSSLIQKINNWPHWVQFLTKRAEVILILFAVTWGLSRHWLPLGAGESDGLNFLFVALLLTLILGGFQLLEWKYESILTWCLRNKVRFLSIPIVLIFLAVMIWFGFSTIFSPLQKVTYGLGWDIEQSKVWKAAEKRFPGIGEEFMPALDEGSFLLMPSSMPHSGMEYNRSVLGQLDMLVAQIPEVDQVVGKMGRVESALDPAPISMFENIINYKPEYMVDGDGHRIRFRVADENAFITKYDDTLSAEMVRHKGLKADDLIADEHGSYFRNWREHIHSPDDIWAEITKVTRIPGITSAPKLQPIETRLIMLQTGMRAPMGIKVYGPNLDTIQAFGMQLEEILKKVPGVKSEAVFADRIVGKPYLQLQIDRDAIARYGLHVEDIQKTIEAAIGGMPITSTVEGRERYPVRVRYPRELRDDPETLQRILVTSVEGAQIPLGELVQVHYEKGPQAIKSENTFLTGYVLFDKEEDQAEVDVVHEAQRMIQGAIDRGELIVPAGVSFKFSGSYENQVRAEKRLSLIVPVVLGLIFLILYFQFRSVSTSLMVFSGVAMAFSGGFLMLWFYGQDWFLNFSLFHTNLRDLFQMQTINLSVAVWVGFIALFGIATDDGVLMATYLDQSFKNRKTGTRDEIRKAVVLAGKRRIKPAVMTSATTIIALLPILTSTGRGSDIMIPMAIPAFGGMLVAAVSYFVVPVLYAWREEIRNKK